MTTLAPPTVVDECGTANDKVTLPENTEGVTYRFENEGVTNNVEAIVNSGFALDGIPTGWVEIGTDTYSYAVPPFTDEDCPLQTGGIEATCTGSVPYLSYVINPEGLPAGSTVDITFLNPSGANVQVLDQPLTGKVLWPGASATEPLQWPGWELVNGEYVNTGGNFGWTRPTVDVLFQVNPETTVTVNYPPESSTCANPPAGTPTTTPAVDNGSAPPSGSTPVVDTAAGVPTSIDAGLAEMPGEDTGLPLAVLLMLVTAGLAVVGSGGALVKRLITGAKR